MAALSRPERPAGAPHNRPPERPAGAAPREAAGSPAPRGKHSAGLPAPRGKRSAQAPTALPTPSGGSTFRERVYGWIRRIPRGKVATYGQIAALAGYPRQARRVGQALGKLGLPTAVPWQRVINAQGRVSDRAPRIDRAIGAREAEQERLLKREGVRFVKGKTDLERYRWRPKA